MGISCSKAFPGWAKTLTVKTMAACIQTGLSKIAIHTRPFAGGFDRHASFTTRGPANLRPSSVRFFPNLILADEINRAPAKVQSALLEAMQERQITIGETTYPLSDPFLVLATQNPIEQEGTYQLPEAQLDRFMFKLNIGYPPKSEERHILDLMATSAPDLRVDPVIEPSQIIAARNVLTASISMIGEGLYRGCCLGNAPPSRVQLRLEGLIRYGASPRATIYLALGARAHAFLTAVVTFTPQDVKSIGPMCCGIASLSVMRLSRSDHKRDNH